MRVQANRRFASVAKGVGSRELVVGTGKDDASDFLDRRVEFKTAACAAPAAAPATIAKAAPSPKGSTAASPRAKRNTESSSHEADLPRGVRSHIERYLGPNALRDLLDD